MNPVMPRTTRRLNQKKPDYKDGQDKKSIVRGNIAKDETIRKQKYHQGNDAKNGHYGASNPQTNNKNKVSDAQKPSE